MVNIFPQAYLIELLQLVCAVIAWLFVAWMVYSTGIDLRRAIDAQKNPRWTVPSSFIAQGKGYFTAEIWRLIETTLLILIGIWMVIHSIDGKPVLFFDIEENLRLDRLTAFAITTCKMMAAFTARYFRHLANAQDGIQHD